MRARSASFYCEIRPAPGLRDDLVCSWVGVVGPEGPPAEDRVLPDGCVDFVWDGERLFVAGPDEKAVELERRVGSAMAGVRLRPGRAPGLLGVAAAELTGLRVDLSELWGRAASGLAERLFAVPDVAAARQLLEEGVVSRLANAPAADRVVAAFVRALEADAGLEVTRLAREVGFSRRQLQRRSLESLGYGPKTFARVVRFQRFVCLARDRPELGLALLARASGYADQAHLTRECRRLAGLTPRELLLWQRRVPFVQDESPLNVVSSNA
jgi:AraC-like DNA-binding protein